MSLLKDGDAPIPERNISITSLTVHPIRDFDHRDAEGREGCPQNAEDRVFYAFMANVEVRIRNLTTVGPLTDKILGISHAVTVRDVSFEVSDIDRIYIAALQKATAKARLRAEELAKSAGAKGVGAPVSLSVRDRSYDDDYDDYHRDPADYLYESMPEAIDRGADMRVVDSGLSRLRPGERAVRVGVTAAFEILT